MKVRHYKKYVIVKKAKSTIHCTIELLQQIKDGEADISDLNGY